MKGRDGTSVRFRRRVRAAFRQASEVSGVSEVPSHLSTIVGCPGVTSATDVSRDGNEVDVTPTDNRRGGASRDITGRDLGIPELE